MGDEEERVRTYDSRVVIKVNGTGARAEEDWVGDIGVGDEEGGFMMDLSANAVQRGDSEGNEDIEDICGLDWYVTHVLVKDERVETMLLDYDSNDEN